MYARESHSNVLSRLHFVSGVKTVIADMLDLQFEDSFFDVVIEKGTMVRIIIHVL